MKLYDWLVYENNQEKMNNHKIELQISLDYNLNKNKLSEYELKYDYIKRWKENLNIIS